VEREQTAKDEEATKEAREWDGLAAGDDTVGARNADTQRPESTAAKSEEKKRDGIFHEFSEAHPETGDSASIAKSSTDLAIAENQGHLALLPGNSQFISATCRCGNDAENLANLPLAH